MSNLEKKRKELEKKKEAFKRKKREWLSDIKFSIKTMEEFLGKIEQKPFILNMKDRKNPYYQNDMTGSINSHLQEIKEIFSNAADEESSLIMEEEDIEDELSEKNANIEWKDYLKTVNR